MTASASPMEQPRSAGRPRCPEKEAAILRAALSLLATQGYTRMTLDAVATTAKVSKATIHLRWKTKADLVTAAVESLRLQNTSPRTGDTRTDLVSELADFAITINRINGMTLIGNCLVEEKHTPELIGLLRARVVLPRRQLLRDTLAAGVATGQVSPDADLDDAVSALVGMYYADRISARPDETEWRRWAERAVTLVLGGVRPDPPA